ncbi:hypothetical protein Taro_043479 [Colocasia esculenta]|uniref:Uncharacterized protein n=1 Tax=Colocasia esculenta TaxID=4460 RepID=A0A843X0S8_COLES|nr:hypothetical protein [Colocasia esculenta]
MEGTSSWDFAAADPCDSLFSAAHFTCGFRCDAYDHAGLARVTDVSLDAAGYSGSLSPSVWSLPYLQTLDANENRLSGRIPSLPPSASLLQLRRVALSRNAFSDEIPAGNFPSLEELYLDGNRLSGSIPASTASLPSLRRLELQMNNLSGGIPDLRSMAVLTYLDASDNAISGPLPPASSLPASLVELSLRNNALEGTLPPALVAGLPKLQVLDLSHNRLSGRVPSALFSHPALEQLTLSHNRFTSLQSPGWWRPPADGGGSELVAVDLGHNRLGGTLPLGWVGAMPRLTALTLENNRFSGMIPTEYAMRVASSYRAGSGGGAGVSPLARLVLAGNYLYGPIPGPLTGVKEGEATVSLANNCLFHCPKTFFFCHGGHQKQPTVCRGFNPVIP